METGSTRAISEVKQEIRLREWSLNCRKRQIARAFQSGSNRSTIEKIKEIDKAKEVYRVDWSK